MKDKVYLITGGTSGLGRAMAESLAATDARVVLLARSQQKLDVTKHLIELSRKNARISVIEANLAEPRSLQLTAIEFNRKYERLDVLINNAATFLPQRQTTDKGLELMFATNYLGHFLLTNLLVEKLATSGRGRVVNVVAPPVAELVFDNLQGELSFDPMKAYLATKTCLLLFSLGLARRLQSRGVMSNAVLPGRFRSKLFEQATRPERLAATFMARTPERAMETPLHVACADNLSGVTGKLFEDLDPVTPPAWIERDDIQDRLWKDSELLGSLDRLAAGVKKDGTYVPW